MIQCNGPCKELLSEDKFYKSSLKKQDHTCSKCSVIKGKTNRLKRFEKDPVKETYRYARNTAKTKGRAFLLTEDEYRHVVSNPCYYCGDTLSGYGINLDRINNDNSVGYRLGNVLPCCYDCNVLRGSRLTVEETKVAIEAIQKLRNTQM